MLRSLAIFPLLTGYRGAPRSISAVVEELLLRISAMVEAHQEIAELDLNPVMRRACARRRLSRQGEEGRLVLARDLEVARSLTSIDSTTSGRPSAWRYAAEIIA